MIAFHEDEDGHHFLEAVKQFCCPHESGDTELHEIVHMAKAVFYAAGCGLPGKEAVWEALQHAGMILLDDCMAKAGVLNSHGPKAVFLCPALGETFMIGFDWQLHKIQE